MHTILSVTSYAMLKSAAYTHRQRLIGVVADLKKASKLDGRDEELKVIEDLCTLLDDPKAPKWSNRVKLPLERLPIALIDTVEAGTWLPFNLMLRGLYMAAKREFYLANRSKSLPPLVSRNPPANVAARPYTPLRLEA